MLRSGKPRRQLTTADRGLLILLAIFACLGATYSVVNPLFESPDELFHYPFVKHLADGHGLPVLERGERGPWHQEGGQPPLYYALAALVTRWVPSDDLPQLLQRNPRAGIGVVQPDGNANMVIHTPREAFPYRGTALAVHLARGLSVVLGLLTVLFAYGTGLEVLPRRPGLALAAAAVVAFTPMFLFISGSVNNDNLVTTLATASLWQLLRLLRLPPTPGRWALLGATIGLAALAKVSGLALLPLAALALGWVAWRRRDWRFFFWGGACVVGTAALIASWWYCRNWRLYGDPLGWNMFLTISIPRPNRPTLTQLWSEWPGFVKSYWGVFGWLNVAAPGWFYRLFNGLALVGAGGLLVKGGRRLWSRRWPAADTAFRLGLLAIWAIVVMASLVRWTMLTMGSQGRLIFPAIAPLSYLLVLGLASWAPARWRSLPPLLATALMGGLAIWVPFGVIAPAYAPPPLLTPAQQAAIPHRLDLSFGDQMELLGYEIGAEAPRRGQDVPVTLYWRAKAPMDQDYSVFIHLLDQNGIKISQRDIFPGGGSFPTTLWQPGDAIADTCFITLPANTFNPNRIRIEAGLYSQESGRRLPIRDAEGRELGDSVRLGEILVQEEPQDGIANPVHFNLENRVALVGYDLDRTALHPGETLRLTLFWKPLKPLTEDYVVFAHVRGADHTLWAGKAGALPDAAEPSGGRQIGQVIRHAYDLVLRHDTPEGDYYLYTGLYRADTREDLGVLDRFGHVQDRRVVLTRIRVLPAMGPEKPGPQSGFPQIQYPLDVAFGNVARFKGFDLDQTTVNPNEPLRLTLYWEAINEGPLPTDYTVFVHLLDADNQIVTQHDGPPSSGDWPTTSWVKGQAIVDRHYLIFEDNKYEGQVLLQVGLYDPQSLQRLTTPGGDDKAILPVQITVRP